MLSITTYTSYDEIRLVLGLTSEEISDTDLGKELFANQLQYALRKVTLSSAYSDNLEVVFAALPADGSRTDDEQEIYNLTRVFATYQVSLDVATAYSALIRKADSDGKRSMSRFSPESAYQDVVNAIKEKLAAVIQALGSVGATGYSLPAYLSVIAPAVDPVTGGSY